MWPDESTLAVASSGSPVARQRKYKRGSPEYSDGEDSKNREGVWYPISLAVFVLCMIAYAMWSASRPAGEKHHLIETTSTTRVRCETTAGEILIDVHHDWSPHGSRRFLDMVNSGFFDTRVALFRAVENFLCQTGIAGDPDVDKAWKKKGTIPDDPQWLKGPRPMKRGYLSFAGSGENSRTTEFFFAFKDLQLGSSPWEVPFGTLVQQSSFDTLDRFYVGYGDIPRFGGHAPNQGRIYKSGLSYLLPNFPNLDYIDRCEVVGSS